MVTGVLQPLKGLRYGESTLVLLVVGGACLTGCGGGGSDEPTSHLGEEVEGGLGIIAGGGGETGAGGEARGVGNLIYIEEDSDHIMIIFTSSAS